MKARWKNNRKNMNFCEQLLSLHKTLHQLCWSRNHSDEIMRVTNHQIGENYERVISSTYKCCCKSGESKRERKMLEMGEGQKNIKIDFEHFASHQLSVKFSKLKNKSTWKMIAVEKFFTISVSRSASTYTPPQNNNSNNIQ